MKNKKKKLKFKYKILIVTVITIIVIMGQTDHTVKAKKKNNLNRVLGKVFNNYITIQHNTINSDRKYMEKKDDTG